jgi:TRAP-type C4-dicarboxylate transport system permease small subunit
MRPRTTAAINSIDAVISWLSRVLSYVGMVILIVMMLLTVADVFMRYIWNHPILGVFELTEYMMIPIVFFGWAWCAKKGGNVQVDLVVTRLGPSAQRVLNIVTYFFGMLIIFVIAWQNLLESKEVWSAHKASDMLAVPAYPFYIVLTIGCFLLCLVLLLNLVQLILGGVKK